MPKVECSQCTRIRPFYSGKAMQIGSCPIMNQIHERKVPLKIHKLHRCKYFKKGRSKFYVPYNPTVALKEGIYG